MYSHIIDKYKESIGLNEWTIKSESISKDQVTYDSDVPIEDRYFIGISIDNESMIGTIYHDRDMTDEDIIHELLHVKYPSLSEKEINNLTNFFCNTIYY